MGGRKKYTAPRMELVSFSMASSVAGSCSFPASEQQDNGWSVDLWSADVCYHIPVEALAVFGS